MTKELTHQFFSFTSQVSAVGIVLFRFCITWTQSSYRDAGNLTNRKFAKVVAKVSLLLCSYFPFLLSPCEQWWPSYSSVSWYADGLLALASFLQLLPTPGPVSFWSHCQAAATAVRAWIYLPLFHPQKGRYLTQSATRKTLLS